MPSRVGHVAPEIGSSSRNDDAHRQVWSAFESRRDHRVRFTTYTDDSAASSPFCGLQKLHPAFSEQKLAPTKTEKVLPITDILATNRLSALSSALLYPGETIQYRDWARIIARSDRSRHDGRGVFCNRGSCGLALRRTELSSVSQIIVAWTPLGWGLRNSQKSNSTHNGRICSRKPTDP
jgi:hypothetical protein